MLQCVSQHLPKLVKKYCVENSLRNDTPNLINLLPSSQNIFNKEPYHNILVFGKSAVTNVLDMGYQHLTRHLFVKTSFKEYLI